MCDEELYTVNGAEAFSPQAHYLFCSLIATSLEVELLDTYRPDSNSIRKSILCLRFLGFVELWCILQIMILDDYPWTPQTFQSLIKFVTGNYIENTKSPDGMQFFTNYVKLKTEQCFFLTYQLQCCSAAVHHLSVDFIYISSMIWQS